MGRDKGWTGSVLIECTTRQSSVSTNIIVLYAAIRRDFQLDLPGMAVLDSAGLSGVVQACVDGIPSQ